ncbi:MAG: molybdopterin converting factor subunit 1 [Gemmatimonadaceae bacterium]
MNVSVLLFASLAEAIGRDRLSIDIDFPITAARLRDHVLATTAASAALRGAIRVAVNECFVEDSSLVREGDEVALLPPVAGG